MKKQTKLVIAIDFDGTCVSHEFPSIGKDIGAAKILKRLTDNGHKLILNTMRSDTEKGNYLSEALVWFKERDITLWGVQKNPGQHHWTSSPKVYANIYIDDANLGCPLLEDSRISEKPFVNWTHVEDYLIKLGVI